MDKLFQSKWAIRVISLVLALTLYFFVNIEANTEQNDSRLDQGTTTETQILDEVPVDIKIDAENYVVSGVPETVSVTLEGKKSTLAPIVRIRSFDVFVDLTEYEEGDHTVTLEYEGLPDNVTAYIEPKEIDINIEKRALKEFSIDVDFVNLDKVPVGYEIGEPEITPGSVTIVSSEANIEQVAMVKVFIDVRDIKESIKNRELPVVVYDAQGNDMSVRVDPETVTVSVPVERPSKTVPLTVKTKGEMIDELEIANMESATELEIFGRKDVLNEIDEISTKELDISTIEKSGKTEVEIDFPDGVTANDEEIEVDVELQQSKEFKAIPIEIEGMNESDVTFIKPKSGELSVIAIGIDTAVKELKKEDITALINLGDVDEGEHKVDVELKGPDGITLDSKEKKITVEVK